MNEPTAIKTVLSYNILEGLQQSPVQIDVFTDWVGNLDPDIVFYQELNGFTEEKLGELARRYGHPYVVKIQQDGYRPGISSKHKLCDVERVTENFRLGYVYARIGNTHLFAIHLDPFEEDDRLKEIEIVLQHASTLPADADIMMVGDFNSLAFSDCASYQSPEFKAYKLTANENWRLRYDVTNTLLCAGYHDAYRLFHSDFTASWPTAKRIVAMADGCRIDYAFLNARLKEKCIAAEIVYDPVTRFLSDHYPLVVKFADREASR
jgi:exodeoxyribonuclease-3